MLIKKNNYNIVRSGILGVAVGDALGVPFEFKKRYSYKFNSTNNMQGYLTHNQMPGTWSDDTSLTLATLDSLINGYDIKDMGDKFLDWYSKGKYTADDKLPFDCGITISRALIRMKINNYKAIPLESTNGNGSLMRMSPVVFYIYFNNLEESKFKIIEEVSSLTHSHIRSIIGCSIYVEFCLQLLKGYDIDTAYKYMQDVIKAQFSEYKNELKIYEDILIGNVKRLDEEDIKSSGYIVDSLIASLWCFMTTSSFSESVLKAINLGNDTDTIGAITGGIAGLFYGEANIPNGWLKVLRKRDYIGALSDEYYNKAYKNYLKNY